MAPVRSPYVRRVGASPAAPTMKKKDLAALRYVLRFVSTSNADVRAEVLRLDAMLEHEQQRTNKPKEQQP